jgi:hypothetical protein
LGHEKHERQRGIVLRLKTQSSEKPLDSLKYTCLLRLKYTCLVDSAATMEDKFDQLALPKKACQDPKEEESEGHIGLETPKG